MEVDGSAKAGEGAAGAAVMWGDELAAERARRPALFASYRLGPAAMFPKVGAGAALAGVYRADSGTAELAAAATAVLMFPANAHVHILIRTDSQATLTGWKSYVAERSERRRQKMAGRVYYAAIERRLKENRNMTLSWEKVVAPPAGPERREGGREPVR